MSKYLVAYTCNIKSEYVQTYTTKIGKEILADDEEFGITEFKLSR